MAFVLALALFPVLVQPSLPLVQGMEWTTAPGGIRGRTPVVQDPIGALWAHDGWSGLDRAEGWRAAEAAPDGGFEGIAGRAWWRAKIVAPEPMVVMLDIQGASEAWVNGEPRGANVYGYGGMSVPAPLQAGENQIVGRGVRGRLRIAMEKAPSHPFISAGDPTLTDVLWEGSSSPQAPAGKWGPSSVVVVNPTGQTVDLKLTGESGAWPQTLRIAPYSLLKSPATPGPFAFDRHDGARPDQCEGVLRLFENGEEVHRQTFSFRVRLKSETHRSGMISGIDGSLQYYAVNPSSRPSPGQALILSLHGASVEAQGQAESYGQKDWANLAAATNRRPFGFDWEDWGLQDALEVLERAEDLFAPDPRRILLTGHSMGGHGTWMLGAAHAARFAAIGPSAGWRSFWTYTGGYEPDESDPIGRVLAAANLQSRPDRFARNHSLHGVFILHGDADDTVPIQEAQAMKEALEPWHPRLGHHWEPGGSHWYDKDPAPGADSVDDARLMAFLKQSQRPELHRRIDFSTFDLSLASQADWLQILQKRDPALAVRVQAELGGDGAVRVTTENAAWIRIDREALGRAGWNGKILLDGAEPSKSASDSFFWREGKWVAEEGRGRRPAEHGPFKRAFNNGFVLVYGTRGSQAENAASFRQARRDAEIWWQRGNGRAVLLSDREFILMPDHQPVLYGGRHVNAAWDSVVAGPMAVDRGRIEIGGRTRLGRDLGVVAILPRRGGGVCGLVAATGEEGARTLEMLPYMSSGVNIPDVAVFSSRMLSDGLSGIEAAGWWGNDWSAGPHIAWREGWQTVR
jgi:dienelactone hydrolase